MGVGERAVVAKEVVVLAMVVKVTALQVVEREVEVLPAVVGLVAVLVRVVGVLAGVVTDLPWLAVGRHAEVERALGTTEGAVLEADLVAAGSEVEQVARAGVMMVVATTEARGRTLTQARARTRALVSWLSISIERLSHDGRR